MALIGWTLLGLLAGAIAKGILPGSQNNDWPRALLLGVVGALLGGFLGSTLYASPIEEFFSLQTWLLAVSGAIVALLIYGLMTRGSRSS